jgi:hypothetical protein
VHVVLPKEKTFYETQDSLLKRRGHYSYKYGLGRLEEAEEMYRRKQLTTSYQYHHGYSLHKPKKGNIFEFKTLQKV